MTYSIDWTSVFQPCILPDHDGPCTWEEACTTVIQHLHQQSITIHNTLHWLHKYTAGTAETGPAAEKYRIDWADTYYPYILPDRDGPLRWNDARLIAIYALFRKLDQIEEIIRIHTQAATDREIIPGHDTLHYWCDHPACTQPADTHCHCECQQKEAQ